MSKRNKKQKVPRRAIFALKPEAFLHLFSGKVAYQITDNPIPPDAKIIDIRFDKWKDQNGVIEILIEHPTIPELVEGQPIPYVKPPAAQSLLLTLSLGEAMERAKANGNPPKLTLTPGVPEQDAPNKPQT